MVFTQSDLFQWFAVILCEIAVFLLATNRRLWKTYPAFYAYIGFIMLRSFLLIHVAFSGTRAIYFYAYWRTEIVIAILMLSATVEIAMAVLRPGRLIPPGACALTVQFAIMATGLLSAVSASLTSIARSELQVYVTLEKVCGGVGCCVLACTLFFTVIFSIRWKPIVASIGCGIAITCLVPAFFNTVEAYFPGLRWHQLWISNSAACGASLLVWMAGLIFPVRQGCGSDNQLEQMRDLLHTTASMRRNLQRMVG